MFILVGILFLGFTISVCADVDAGIMEYEEDASWGEKVISTIILSLGRGVEYILSKTGISIESVVYNDDSGLPEGTKNKLAFSFDDDNTFGNIALTVYELFRKIVLLFMLPILAALGIKVWLKPSTSSNLVWKNTLLSYVISFVLLFIMPTLLKAMHTLILVFVNAFRSSGGLSFMSVLKENAESGHLIDAILFCGGIGLAAWFGIIYAARNVKLVFLIIVFPVFAAIFNSEKLRKGYEGWLKEVASALLMNLMDAVLLLILAMILTMNLGAFLSLVIASCIIPIRKSFRELLGLSSGGMSEMGGIMALTGAAGLAGAAGRGIRKGAGQISEGRDDIRESKKYGNAAEKIKGSMAQNGDGISPSATPFATGGGIDDSDLPLGGPPMLSAGALLVETSADTARATNGSATGMSPDAARTFAQLKSDKLRRQGMKKIRGAGLSMAGGALGGAAAGMFASMQGFPAMAYGTRIGGEFGSTAGYLAGMGISEIKKDEFYNEEEKEERRQKEAAKTSQAESVIGEATVMPERGSIEQKKPLPREQGLPKDVGMNEEGQFTFENVTSDMDKYLDDDIKDNIKERAHQNAIEQTGIDPQALQSQYEQEAQRLYDEELQNLAAQGEPITIEAKANAHSKAQKQAEVNLNIKGQVAHFSQVAEINQEAIQLDAAYNKLQASGYSPGLLDEYSKTIRDELKSILEQKVQDMNFQDDVDVDDII